MSYEYEFKPDPNAKENCDKLTIYMNEKHGKMTAVFYGGWNDVPAIVGRYCVERKKIIPEIHGGWIVLGSTLESAKETIDSWTENEPVNWA